ncbi:MAG TPA: TraB/GumN family protein, partial [Thermodesulfobacteriota bacterium]|nr:TraB/GumN family protein [Thermodesulfobacteriota bacterium]
PRGRNKKMEWGRSKLSRISSVLVFASLAIFVLDALSQSQKSFLWKVQSKTNTVYVLGSIHFARKDIYPLNQKVENAFDQSDLLVVEANVNDIKKIDIQKLMEQAVYPDNDTLEKHISPETIESLKKETGGLGIPFELVNKQKPWFLAMTLVALESIKLGLDPNLGIDKYFLSKAEGKKKMLELESVDEQISLLSGFSDKDQELFLIYTLKDLHIMEQEVNQLTQAWISGDTKSMESLLTKSFSEDKRFSAIFEKLIFERNRRMVSKIEDFLRTKETYFVIVGAGHLVGSQGVIELLKGKGYLVEQL